MNKIAEFVKENRKAAGLTQEERRCQCSVSYNADPAGTVSVEDIVFLTV